MGVIIGQDVNGRGKLESKKIGVIIRRDGGERRGKLLGRKMGVIIRNIEPCVWG